VHQVNSPLVSVIVPTLNRYKKLVSCVDSIINSDYNNIELIIIDNGSQDSSINYLTELKNSEIKVILNNENLGLAKARNQGVIASNGAYILFIDDDNLIEETMITELVKFLESDKTIGIVSPKTLYKDEPNKIWFYGANINFYTSKTKFFNKNILDTHDRINYNLNINCVHNCFMVRKDLFDSLGLFDDKLFVSYTEFDFCMRAFSHCKIYLCGNAKCYHDRLHTDKINSLAGYGFLNNHRVFCLIRNRCVMIIRYANIFQKLIFLLIFYPIIFIYYSLIFIKYKSIKYLIYHLKGFLAGLKYIYHKKLIMFK